MANLYVDIDERAVARLTATMTRLYRTGRYFQDAELDHDPIQLLLDVLFGDGTRKQWHAANLSIGDTQDRTKLALRPVIHTAEAWPFPRSFSLTVVGSWPLKAPQPVFRITDIFETADSPTRDFEAVIDTFVYQSERVPRGVPIQDNVLNSSLLQALPLISRSTRDRLQDWTDFINWKRNLVRASARGVRYVSRRWNEAGNALLFTVQATGKAPVDEALRILGMSTLHAFPVEASTDPWEFIPIEDNDARGRARRGPVRGYEMGSSVRSSLKELGKVAPREGKTPGGLQWTWEVQLSDDDTEQILSKPESKTELLARIPEQGFVSASLAGDLSLLRRHEQAVTRLRDQGGHSPYLSAYLFDVAKARLPQVQGPEPSWISQDLNSPQKEAVRKILDAPDLCLLQGPPGTGKTTVIAEAIAQLVRRGETVLLASQAHTAVDNALGRLATDPSVRAIRLGPSSKVTEDGQPFIATASLKRFYGALAVHPSREHLDRWCQEDETVRVLTAWCEEAEFVLLDADRLAAQEADHRRQRERLIAEIREQRDAIDRTERENELTRRRRAAALSLADLRSPPPKNTDGTIPASLLTSAKDAALAVFRLATLDVPLSSSESEWQDLPDHHIALLKVLARSTEKVRDASRTLMAAAIRIESTPDAAHDPTLRLQLDALTEEVEQLEEAASNSDASTEIIGSWRQKRMELQALRQQASSALDADACRQIFTQADEWIRPVENADIWVPRLKARLTTLEAPLQAAEAALRQLEEDAKRASQEMCEAAIDLGLLHTAEAQLRQHEFAANTLRQNFIDVMQRAKGALSKHPQSAALPATEGDVASCLRTALKVSQEELIQLGHRTNLQAETRRAWEPLLKDWVRDLQDEKSARVDWDTIGNDWPSSCNVVAITCNESPRTLDEQGHAGFDVVIIDEVSKATPLELLLPLMRARRAVLVGDHRQLPPLFQESLDAVTFSDAAEDAAENETAAASQLTEANLRRYERMVTASLFKEHFEKAPDAIRGRLSVQFRMHPQIMEMVNHFYEGSLQCGLPDPDRQRHHGLRLPDAQGGQLLGPEDHVLWIDTSHDLQGQRTREDHGPDGRPLRTNTMEVELIVQLLHRLDEQALATRGPKAPRLSVGIVSFYAGQLRKLRQAIRARQPAGGWKCLDVDSNTVIKYQGKEKDIVLVSLVRNDGGARRHKSSRSNVARYEFINVAMSRARSLLVMLGARTMFEDLEVALPRMNESGVTRRAVYRDMFRKLELDGRMVSARQVMEPTSRPLRPFAPHTPQRRSR